MVYLPHAFGIGTGASPRSIAFGNIPNAMDRPLEWTAPDRAGHLLYMIITNRAQNNSLYSTRINSAGALLAFRLLFDVFPQFIRG